MNSLRGMSLRHQMLQFLGVVADVTGIGYCRIIFRSKANIPKFKHVKMWNLNRKIVDFRQSFAYFLKLKFFEMKPDQRWEFITEKKKKISFSFFLGQERVFFSFSLPLSFILYFLYRFLIRERVFFLFFLFPWSLSLSKACFLVFFYKFPLQKICNIL